jgi:hypothetical protein
MARWGMTCNQATMLATYARDTDARVRVAAARGVCMALACLYAKLSPQFRSEADILWVFRQYEADCVREQVIAYERHGLNGTGFDYILRSAQLHPQTTNFVPFALGTVTLAVGQPCIHMFDVPGGSHAICHARLASNELTTFDPNVGILVGDDTDWNAAMIVFVNQAYPQTANHRAVIVMA